MVKLHDRSLDPDPRYSAGIDWRARFTALQRQQPGRIRFVETGDASPLLAAADLMVTDHSSIGFEYLVLDRPLLVFDAPNLPAAARINAEKVALLRSAATVVRTTKELTRAAVHAIQAPGELSSTRRRIAGELFFAPGGATDRAVHLVRRMLHCAHAGVGHA
jgi:CDP-glycerol glycerophosphotransferase (TagB/SpsB family)